MTPDIIAALRKCRDQFEFYAQEHRIKVDAAVTALDDAKYWGNVDEQDKARKELEKRRKQAATNEEMVVMCDAALSTSPAGQEVLPDCITNGDVEAWIFSHQDKDADMEAARMALFRFRSSLSSAQPAVTEENGGHCYCWCHPNAGAIGCSPCCDAEDNYLPPSKRDPALSSVEPAGNGREVDWLTRRIAEVVEEDGGCWRACSGCQESVDGCVSARDYPYSAIFKCQPGSGCRECGGLGVIYDDGAFLAGYGEALSSPPAAEQEVVAKPWYEVDAHRDLSRIIPDMEGKIADAKKRYAHCLPDHLFAPLEASISELKVLRHEVATHPAPALDGVSLARDRVIMSSVRLGKWMSAALDDPNVCEEMKADIRDWFSAGEPVEGWGAALSSPSEGESAPASSGAGDDLRKALKEARDALLTVGNDYPGSSCQRWCTDKARDAWNALQPWKHCPSTHCERAQECRSVNECSAEGATLTAPLSHDAEGESATVSREGELREALKRAAVDLLHTPRHNRNGAADRHIEESRNRIRDVLFPVSTSTERGR